MVWIEGLSQKRGCNSLNCMAQPGSGRLFQVSVEETFCIISPNFLPVCCWTAKT